MYRDLNKVSYTLQVHKYAAWKRSTSATFVSPDCLYDMDICGSGYLYGPVLL